MKLPLVTSILITYVYGITWPYHGTVEVAPPAGARIRGPMYLIPTRVNTGRTASHPLRAPIAIPITIADVPPDPPPSATGGPQNPGTVLVRASSTGTVTILRPMDGPISISVPRNDPAIIEASAEAAATATASSATVSASARAMVGPPAGFVVPPDSNGGTSDNEIASAAQSSGALSNCIVLSGPLANQVVIKSPWIGSILSTGVMRVAIIDDAKNSLIICQPDVLGNLPIPQNNELNLNLSPPPLQPDMTSYEAPSVASDDGPSPPRKYIQPPYGYWQ